MAGRNGLDAAAALLVAYLLRLEGRMRRHQLRFADVRFPMWFIRGSSSKRSWFSCP
jgi:hypothetical protein